MCFSCTGFFCCLLLVLLPKSVGTGIKIRRDRGFSAPVTAHPQTRNPCPPGPCQPGLRRRRRTGVLRFPPGRFWLTKPLSLRSLPSKSLEHLFCRGERVAFGTASLRQPLR